MCLRGATVERITAVLWGKDHLVMALSSSPINSRCRGINNNPKYLLLASGAAVSFHTKQPNSTRGLLRRKQTNNSCSHQSASEEVDPLKLLRVVQTEFLTLKVEFAPPSLFSINSLFLRFVFDVLFFSGLVCVLSTLISPFIL